MNRIKAIISTALMTAVPASVAYAEPDAHTAQKHGFFDGLVNFINNSYLFQRYISTWGAPLNNASFIAALLVIIVLLCVWSAIELFLNWKKSKKILKANKEKLEKRRQQEAEDALLREFMRFKMIAEANGVADANGVTFEQWLAARVDTGQVNMSELTPKQQEAVTEAKEVAADVKETVSDKAKEAKVKAGAVATAAGLMHKKEPTEEEKMDAAIAQREKEDEAVRKAREFEKRQEEQLKAMRTNNTPTVVSEVAKQEITKPTPVPKKQETTNWLNNAEAIKKKYATGPKATELVDLPDMDEDAVPLSQAAIVKPVAVKERPKAEVKKEEKKPIDVNRLLEEKSAEMKDDMGTPISADEQTTFDQIIAALNQQKAAENRAKELSAEAEAAKEANIEILKGDLEQSYDTEAVTETTGRSTSKEDRALEEAKKRALKEQEREERKRGRK